MIYANLRKITGFGGTAFLQLRAILHVKLHVNLPLSTANGSHFNITESARRSKNP